MAFEDRGARSASWSRPTTPRSSSVSVSKNSCRTSAAFGRFHAARTGRPRVADGERVQQIEALGVVHRAAEAHDRVLVAEVAPGGGVGEQQVVLRRATPAPRRRGRRARCACRPDGAISAPASEWSPGRPLPMSWSSAPSRRSSGRVRRATSPSKPSSSRTAAHSATHSRRCRSTVKRWYALRCGRARTCPHSGSSAASTPTWSRASNTGTALRPARSRPTNASRASGSTRRRAAPRMRSSERRARWAARTRPPPWPPAARSACRARARSRALTDRRAAPRRAPTARSLRPSRRTGPRVSSRSRRHASPAIQVTSRAAIARSREQHVGVVGAEHGRDGVLVLERAARRSGHPSRGGAPHVRRAAGDGPTRAPRDRGPGGRRPRPAARCPWRRTPRRCRSPDRDSRPTRARAGRAGRRHRP